ncbi:MAG TPA: CPBP family intramembrane glutamic endopeptidase, partial [Chitinispirillaceae bacterium]|nr:CPBP family intramembrane glutamic endopeptidase [Chitinispirillaceae bacterium]
EVKKEGAKGIRQISEQLCIRRFTQKDWKYASIGLLLVFILTGAIFGISNFLTVQWGVRPLSTTPWFMEMHPFVGKDQLLLFIWLPMFFFNIAGEEILWRGYIQARLKSKYPWLLCSCLWLLFHLPFGMDLLLLLVPVIIIIPYSFSKTNNTLVGIFIHGVYNGPLFVAVALGLLG